MQLARLFPLHFKLTPVTRDDCFASKLFELRDNGQIAFFGTYGDLRGGSVNGQSILLVPPESSFEKQADGFQFPNDMALSADGRILASAEPLGSIRLLSMWSLIGAFSNRSIWVVLPIHQLSTAKEPSGMLMSG